MSERPGSKFGLHQALTEQSLASLSLSLRVVEYTTYPQNLLIHRRSSVDSLSPSPPFDQSGTICGTSQFL